MTDTNQDRLEKIKESYLNPRSDYGESEWWFSEVRDDIEWLTKELEEAKQKIDVVVETADAYCEELEAVKKELRELQEDSYGDGKWNKN